MLFGTQTNKGLKNRRLEDGRADTSGLGGMAGYFLTFHFLTFSRRRKKTGLAGADLTKGIIRFDDCDVLCTIRGQSKQELVSCLSWVYCRPNRKWMHFQISVRKYALPGDICMCGEMQGRIFPPTLIFSD